MAHCGPLDRWPTHVEGDNRYPDIAPSLVAVQEVGANFEARIIDSFFLCRVFKVVIHKRARNFVLSIFEKRMIVCDY